MKRHLFSIALILMFLTSLGQDKDGFNVYWKDGFRVESANGDFKIKFGGRFMLDGIVLFPDQVLDTIINQRSGVEIRRVRLYSSGQVYRNIKYKLQFDFAGGMAQLKDAYITITRIPVIGNIQFGHFKEPLGLELLTSSKYITMIERSLTNPLLPERNTGVMLFNDMLDERMTWAAGAFLPADNFGNYSGNKYHLTGRLTGLPYYQTEGGYRLVHLGLGYTFQYQNNEKYTLKSRPEAHLAPTLVLAEIDHAKHVNQVSGELAVVLGPFHVQGEYVIAGAKTSDNSALMDDVYTFQGFHVIGSWFITGEHKNYETDAAAFGRVKPKKNLGEKDENDPATRKGAGAFELTARYSALDLNDTDVNGGYMSNFTAGLNWHLNPVTRIMFNYVHVNVRNLGSSEIALVRLQIDF